MGEYVRHRTFSLLSKPYTDVGCSTAYHIVNISQQAKRVLQRSVFTLSIRLRSNTFSIHLATSFWRSFSGL